MGMNEDQPVTEVQTCIVEFIGEKAALHAFTVHHLMEAHGFNFQKAIDFLELRPDYHFTVVREVDAEHDN